VLAVHIPDLSSKTYLGHPKDGFEYLSVGWLGDEVTHAGDTDPVVLLALQHLCKKNQLPDSCGGLHICGICFRNAPPPLLDEMGWDRCARDKGEFFVEDGTTRYVLPNMVHHYITEHGYRLPAVVEAALRRPARPTQ
jgi:hypothetical protein